MHARFTFFVEVRLSNADVTGGRNKKGVGRLCKVPEMKIHKVASHPSALVFFFFLPGVFDHSAAGCTAIKGKQTLSQRFTRELYETFVNVDEKRTIVWKETHHLFKRFYYIAPQHFLFNKHAWGLIIAMMNSV